MISSRASSDDDAGARRHRLRRGVGRSGIYGLYATIVPLLAYALFGPSRILVLGPDSSLAAVILGVVLPLSGGDPMRAVALAGAMAIVSGTVCILAGVAASRLYHRASVEADPLWLYERHRADGTDQPISQAVRFLDRKRWAAARLVAIGEAVLDGRTNWTAFAVGAGTLAIILLLKGNKRMPGILIAVVGATIVARPLRPCRARRRLRARAVATGPSALRPPWITATDIVASPDWRWPSPWCPSPIPASCRGSMPRGPGARRPEPGDGGPWRGKSRRRLLPGIPDQQ